MLQNASARCGRRTDGSTTLASAERGRPGRAVAGTQWWRLPTIPETGYLWQYLTYHLTAAGLAAELDQVCCDLRFLAIRLRQWGTAAVEGDLARSASPTAGQLRQTVAQAAHLLGPIEPIAALTTILTGRLGGVPEVAKQLPALRSDLHAWTAWPARRLPDQPSDALTRTVAGHVGPVNAVAIAADGTWLASGGNDGTVRIWAADGTPRARLHRPWRPGERGGDRARRDLASQRRRGRGGADLGRYRPWHPMRPPPMARSPVSCQPD